MQGEAKAPGEILKPFYLQRRCAVVIAGLAWSGLGVQLYFDVQEALIKNEPVHVFNFFSFFTIQTNILIALVLTIFCTQPQAERFLTGTSVVSALVALSLSAWSMSCCCGIYGTRRECSSWPTWCCMTPCHSLTLCIGWCLFPRVACDGPIRPSGFYIPSFFSSIVCFAV
jgi:hypothetical protein